MGESVAFWGAIGFIILFLLIAFGIGKLTQKFSSRYTNPKKAKIVGWTVFGILSVIILYYSILDMINLRLI